MVSLSFRPSLSHCLGFYLSISGHSFGFFFFLVSSASSLFIEIPGHGCVGSGARWSGGRQAPLPRCFSRFRWRGGWSASGFGFGGPKAWSVGPWHVRREAGTKTPVFLFSAMLAGGRRRETVPFKTTPFGLPFFKKKKRMKRRRFGENASFHSNVAPETRQRSHQSPNYFCSFQLRPCQFRSRPPSWPPFPL